MNLLGAYLGFKLHQFDKAPKSFKKLGPETPSNDFVTEGQVLRVEIVSFHILLRFPHFIHFFSFPYLLH